VGGVTLIDPVEAFLLLGKWVDESTRVRIDGTMSSCRFSCVGTLESATLPMVCLRLESLGFIDIYLPENIGFEWIDPVSMRFDPGVGEGYDGQPIRHGSVLAATNTTGERFLFIEVIEEA
jgi:hypothetical protein